MRFSTYTYDEQGRAVYSGWANGINETTLQFVDDATSIVTDALGKARTYKKHLVHGQYKTAGIDAECNQNCGGGAQNTIFDANGYPDRVTDFRGTITDYDYEPVRGLEVRRIEAQGTPVERLIQTHWHPTFRLPTCVIEPLRTTELIYTERGQLQARNEFDTSDSAIFPDLNAKSCATIAARPDALSLKQRRWHYQYNAAGLLEHVNGPLAPDAQTGQDDITTYTYNRQGQMATLTNALGHTTRFLRYDAHGRPLRIKDPNGLLTELSYDPRGRVVRTRTAQGGQALVTHYTYTATGQLDVVTFADTNTLDYDYDEADRLVQIKDQRGNVIRYTLDKLGNRIKTETLDPEGQLRRTQSQLFDATNRLIRQEGMNRGGETIYIDTPRYDENGNLLQQTNALNQTTEFSYDPLNRLEAVIDPVNGPSAPTRYGYDAQGRINAITDPNGLTTRYRYDGLGNLLEVASPDTGVTALPEYDTLGNVLRHTDARGQTTTYEYDVLGRLDLITYGDGSQEDYTWDQGPQGKGRLTSIDDSSGRTTWRYDAWGRVLGKSSQIGPMSRELTYRYDAQGKLVAMTYPSGETLRYVYEQGELVEINLAGRRDALITGITYDPFGPATGWLWGDGKDAKRYYDEDGLLELYARGSTFVKLEYDATGQVRAAMDVNDLVPSLEEFRYDGLQRLTHYQTPTLTAPYELDPNGNRRTVSINEQQYVFTTVPGTNRLQSASGPAFTKTYSYDPAGNVTSDGIHSYGYDARGRLTSLNNDQYRYGINALGERVLKRAPNTCTYYVYDEAGRLIGEYDKNGNAIQETIYLGDLPVAILKPAGIYYIYADQLNAPRLITRADHTPVWQWHSGPFGAAAPSDDLDGNGKKFTYNLRFPGQYFDQESGLHYNYYRTYDPQTGRYLEPDPIGLAGGLNLYSYVNHNPVNYTDALGLSPDAVVDPPETKEPNAAQQFLLDVMINSIPGSGVYEAYQVGGLTGAFLLATEIPGLKQVKGVCRAVGKATVQANKAAGDAFEQQVMGQLQQVQSGVVQQVTVKTQNGVRTRIDLMGRDANGNIVCTECKSSATAPLTRNQAAAFPEIQESGAVIVGKGKPGFPGGTQIPPTAVDIIRQ